MIKIGEMLHTFTLWRDAQLIDAEWRICASVNYAIIGLDNGLLPAPSHYLNQC